ncbi:MAG: sporulation protein YabP [Firmicutes bacterium]|nr:sporulation protein YabP [Bacillota bacterium]
MDQSTKSNLTLENRNNLVITGIKKIKATEPTQIIANLENVVIYVTGSNLSVQNLNIKEGILELTGLINGIKYTTVQTRKVSFKNLFRG